jgi:hypothetical protein
MNGVASVGKRDARTVQRLPLNRIGELLAWFVRSTPATRRGIACGCSRTSPFYSHRQHTAPPLSDGTVLVAGGTSGSAIFQRTELYRADSKTWEPVGDMEVACNQHTATRLPDGSGLVAAGFGYQAGTNRTELYHRRSKTWGPASDMIVKRRGHTATLLHDATVLVAAGIADIDSSTASAEMYVP